MNGSLGVPGLDKYERIEASPGLSSSISSIVIKIYYTDDEIAAAGLNESSLGVYWFNVSDSSWVRLSENISWVYDTGFGSDINGKYVWAKVSHFSYYTVGGESLSCILAGNYAPCGEVTLQEIVDFINKWADNQASLSDVMNLITAWADPATYPPQ